MKRLSQRAGDVAASVVFYPLTTFWILAMVDYGAVQYGVISASIGAMLLSLTALILLLLALRRERQARTQHDDLVIRIRRLYGPGKAGVDFRAPDADPNPARPPDEEGSP